MPRPAGSSSLFISVSTDHADHNLSSLGLTFKPWKPKNDLHHVVGIYNTLCSRYIPSNPLPFFRELLAKLRFQHRHACCAAFLRRFAGGIIKKAEFRHVPTTGPQDFLGVLMSVFWWLKNHQTPSKDQSKTIRTYQNHSKLSK